MLEFIISDGHVHWSDRLGLPFFRFLVHSFRFTLKHFKNTLPVQQLDRSFYCVVVSKSESHLFYCNATPTENLIADQVT